MVEMIEALRRKDFAAFAELTMKDSNQFHATCLDTYPPIFYLNSVSQQVINLVHRYNRHYGETRVSNFTLLSENIYLAVLVVVVKSRFLFVHFSLVLEMCLSSCSWVSELV